MVDLAEIQAAYYMVAATGVLVAAIYYVFNMRATLQTRQAQILMNLYQKWTEPQWGDAWNDIMLWEWTDVDDYISKYWSDPDERRKYGIVGGFLEGLGVFVKRGFIDATLVDDLMSSYIVSYWQKFGTIALEFRKRMNNPVIGEYCEYLYNVIYPIYVRQHPETPTPGTPGIVLSSGE